MIYPQAICKYYHHNDMEDKITKMWLANEEGIFS